MRASHAIRQVSTHRQLSRPACVVLLAVAVLTFIAPPEAHAQAGKKKQTAALDLTFRLVSAGSSCSVSLRSASLDQAIQIANDGSFGVTVSNQLVIKCARVTSPLSVLVAADGGLHTKNRKVRRLKSTINGKTVFIPYRLGDPVNSSPGKSWGDWGTTGSTFPGFTPVTYGPLSSGEKGSIPVVIMVGDDAKIPTGTPGAVGVYTDRLTFTIIY